ncbi:MAG: hypothetical protein OIF48_14530 [Silicimonas sp.]|nr:hypothetical protein [Silicimonas sp.]
MEIAQQRPPSALSGSGLDWIGPIAVSAIGLISTAWLMFFSGAGQAGAPAALVFPPGWEAAQVYAAAATLDVAIVGLGPVDFVAVVVPQTDAALDQFRDSGALLALNSAAANLCR